MSLFTSRQPKLTAGTADKRSSRHKKTQSVAFPFEKVPNQLFAESYRPIVTVSLWSAAAHKWRTVQMLLDTGADYTILPRYIATWLEIDLSHAQEIEAQGVGGVHTIQFIPDLKIKIGHFERQIPVGIIASTKVPPLLGRQNAIEVFQVILDKHQRVTFSE